MLVFGSGAWIDRLQSARSLSFSAMHLLWRRMILECPHIPGELSEIGGIERECVDRQICNGKFCFSVSDKMYYGSQKQFFITYANVCFRI